MTPLASDSGAEGAVIFAVLVGAVVLSGGGLFVRAKAPALEALEDENDTIDRF